MDSRCLGLALQKHAFGCGPLTVPALISLHATGVCHEQGGCLVLVVQWRCAFRSSALPPACSYLSLCTAYTLAIMLALHIALCSAHTYSIAVCSTVCSQGG